MNIAMITGSGRKGGLGFETAKQLGQHGYHVILAARKAQKASPGLLCCPMMDRQAVSSGTERSCLGEKNPDVREYPRVSSRTLFSHYINEHSLL